MSNVWATYEKHGRGYLDLRLGPEDSDEIRSGLLVRETDGAIRLRLDIVDEDALFAKERTVVSPRNGDRLVDVVLVLPTESEAVI